MALIEQTNNLPTINQNNIEKTVTQSLDQIMKEEKKIAPDNEIPTYLSLNNTQLKNEIDEKLSTKQNFFINSFEHKDIKNSLNLLSLKNRNNTLGLQKNNLKSSINHLVNEQMHKLGELSKISISKELTAKQNEGDLKKGLYSQQIEKEAGIQLNNSMQSLLEREKIGTQKSVIDFSLPNLTEQQLIQTAKNSELSKLQQATKSVYQNERFNHNSEHVQSSHNKLTYVFSDWGKGHLVNISLPIDNKPIILEPSDELVHQRFTDQNDQNEHKQPDWVFQDEQETSQEERKTHLTDEA